jgi:S-DNA-T family DNA segregation ATPase FtsK/SpoIIIE
MILIGTILSFNVTIKTLFDAIRARREDKKLAEETKLGATNILSKREAPAGGGLRLNSSVPLAKSGENSKSLEEDQPLTKKKNLAALTASSDPDWNFPDVKLLEAATGKADAGDWKGNADIIKQTLADFGIEVEMDAVNVGPRVTQYTLNPQSGVRLTKITALEQNIALNLAAESIRIEAPIPGKRLVGIEVPNQKSAIVRLRSILESKQWTTANRSPLPIGIGQDISGDSMVASLDKMPHVLVAGQTGSGKSIMINSLLCSLAVS